MPLWEYAKINLNELPRRQEDIDLLNAAGEDGWDLVAITANNVAYLKRQLAAATPTQSASRTGGSSRQREK